MDDSEKKVKLKEMIHRLHEGEDPDAVKAEFKEVLDQTEPNEISKIEDELVNEGMPRERLHKLCDVHLAMFKERLEDQPQLAPEGHPIHTLMEEHKMLTTFAEKLNEDANELAKAPDLSSAKDIVVHIAHIIDHLKEAEKHYLREENVLFPTLDKYGVKEPPKIMWMEHDRIRGLKKGLFSLYDDRENLSFDDFRRRLKQSAIAISEMTSDHFFKENNILFPAAMNVVPEDEWADISRQFAEVGYCCFTPGSATGADEDGGQAQDASKGLSDGRVKIGNGTFSPVELEAILNTAPFDMTFVDKDDRVRYFTEGKERIFVRTRAVIGRQVQMCHPQKSLHTVERILSDFKSGKKDDAEFWIKLKGRLVHIRYFAVRDKDGEYLGTLEVSQDLTDLKNIEGEKRLLD